MWKRMRWPGGLRSNQFSAVMALSFVIVAGIYAEYQSNIVAEQEARARVAEKLAIVRATLEGDINADVQLVRGLVAVVASEPEIDQERFETLARELVNSRSHLRSVAAAPDLVVTMTYPIEGNERALGLDYREVPDQRAAAERARDTGALVMAGPLDLVQGGRGLIGRYPVFASDENGDRYFWGLVAAVVDVERLFASAGLNGGSDIDIAIRGRDGQGAAGERFFGSQAVFDDAPELMSVVLPSGGTWLLAARPVGGWQGNGAAWMIRMLFGAAGALIVIPILISGRLVDERQQHIHTLREREETLARVSHRLQLALDASQIGIWELNVATGELFWDARMKDLYGVDPARPVVGYETWRNAIHPDDLATAEDEFQRVVDGEDRYDSAFRVDLGDGRTRHIRAIGAAYLHGGGARHIVGVNWDVSKDVELNERLKKARDLAEARNDALEEAKAQMEYNALHDPLTGLPNRRYLDRVLSGEGDEMSPHALMHIDLDRFKQINDTLGHAAGDRMLQHTAAIMTACVRDGDVVARIGGDEFVVVFTAPIGADELARLATTIIEAMRQPLRYEGQDCRAGVSVGIAFADDDARELLVNSDIALYEAKSRGRNRYEFFSVSLQHAAIRHKTIADEILRGIEQDEFVAYYQPQHDSRSLNVVGAEVLVRWQHPERGLLPPADFLHIAEEINAIAQIDQRILEQATVQSLRWIAAGIDVPKISVNISSSRLNDENLIESLKGLRFEPSTLAFELVESTFLDDDKDVISANIGELKKLGIDIEIDDFGTGYASIISLLKLKPRRLKIDRQLVGPITNSAAQRHLVSSIIDIGKSLQIDVVAEGVETMDHVRILRRLGCPTLQGYFFARPMSAGDLGRFIVNGGHHADGGARATKRLARLA